MTGEYIVSTISRHEPIEGADKICKISLFGETLIVQKESNPVGTRGIVVDCLSVLDTQICHHLNMYRHSSLNSDQSKTGYIEDNGRVRAIALRKVKCSGLFLSFKQLAQHPKLDLESLDNLKDGVQGNKILGVDICKQFVRKVKTGNLSGKQGKARTNIVPTFREHIDTDQLSRNLDKIKEGDFVIITEKQHGTSLRVANLPVIDTSFKGKILSKIGIRRQQEYKFVVGSRRVTKSVGSKPHGDKAHYYEEDIWTKVAFDNFEDKLKKGETVYCEIVGYLPDGGLIMPSSSNKKLKPFLEKQEYKDFTERYGDDTVFTYGCAPKECKVFIYRITLTNDDGHQVDYPWEVVKKRCAELDVPHVPELVRMQLSAHQIGKNFVDWDADDETTNNRDLRDALQRIAKQFAEEPSDDFPSHLREGVCVRVDNGYTPLILKEKAYNFKVLEGIIKETQDTMEDEA